MIAAGVRAIPGRLGGEADKRGGVVVTGVDGADPNTGFCGGSVGIGSPKWVGDVSEDCTGLTDPDVKMLVL